MIGRALLYAGGAAGLAALWTLLEFALGWHGERAEIGRISGFVGLLFPLVLIPLGVRAEKRAASGSFGWSRGLRFALIAAAVFAAAGAAFFFAYHSWINPGFGRLMAEQASPAQANAVRAAFAPAAQAATAAVSGFVVVLLIGAIATAFLRRAPRG